MAHTFIVRTAESESGPYTSRELRKLAADGDLARDHYVKRDDQDQWHEAGIIKGLFSKASQSTGRMKSAAPRANLPESAEAVNSRQPEASQSQPAVLQPGTPGTLEAQAAQPVAPMEIPIPRGLTLATAGLTQSVLAIASLVLGSAAIVICWVPTIGVIGIVAAGLGLLMAAAALSMTMTRDSGRALSIVGCVTCVIALLLAIAMNPSSRDSIRRIAGRFTGSGESAVGAGMLPEGTDPYGEAMKATLTEKWHPADKALRVGDVEISVTSARVSRAWIRDDFALAEKPFLSLDHVLSVTLQLVNLSETKILEYHTWNGAQMSLDLDFASLRDNFDNLYKRIDFGPGSQPEGRTESQTVQPGKTVTDVLVFQPPMERAEYLNLLMPAGNFGGHGLVRLRVPVTMIVTGPPLEMPQDPQPTPESPPVGGDPPQSALGIQLHPSIVAKHLDDSKHLYFDLDWDTSQLLRPIRYVAGSLVLKDRQGEVRVSIAWTIDDSLNPGLPFHEDGVGFAYNTSLDNHNWVIVSEIRDIVVEFVPRYAVYADGEHVGDDEG